MLYIVTNILTGEEVYRYTATAPIAWDGMGFTTHAHLALEEYSADAPQPTTVFSGRRLLTKLEFRSLFSNSSIKAIDRFQTQFEYAEFLTDEQKDDIRTSLKNYDEAKEIDLDDTRWIPGLGMYVELGMMTTEEVAEVLRG